MAERISLAATASTPAVTFDPAEGVLDIQGESYPENVVAFYRPVLDAVQAYVGEGTGPLVLRIALTYLNTSSIKVIMDLIDLAEDVREAGREARVEWYYEEDDDRSLELAEEFSEDISLPFDIIATAAKSA